MKLRLLLITLICLVCSSFDDAAEFLHYRQDASVESAISESDHDTRKSSLLTNSSHERFEVPRQKAYVPRQTDYTSQTQTQSRTVTKRSFNQRFQFRFAFYIAGKPFNISHIEAYQQEFQHSSSGLMTPYRHHLSLGRLII